MKTEEFLTLKELAEIFKCDAQYLRRSCKRGNLPGYLIGGKYMFKKDEVEAWLEDQKVRKGGNHE